MAESGIPCSAPFPVGEVVKQGYLFVKRPPRRCWEKLRAWHKRYFVLRDETQEKSSHIEMYEGKGCVTVSALENSKPKMILHLDQCVHIGYTTESSKFPYAMVLVCQGKSPLLLAADDELGIRSWLLALSLITHKGYGNTVSQCLDSVNPTNDDTKKKSSIDSSDKSCTAWQPCRPVGEGKETTCRLGDPFQVTVQQTEASQKAGLSGDLRLVVCRHGVGLIKSREVECSVLWPVGYIRQFRHQTLSGSGWSRSTVITLEVGRRCSTGEGIFQFKTQKGQEIIRELKKMVELWSSRKNTDLRRHSRQEDQQTISTSKSGHSAPCTPSIVLPQMWQKRNSNGQVLTSPNEQKDDLNYVIPTMSPSPVPCQRKLSCDIIKGRLLHPPSAPDSFIPLGRSLPATPERLSLHESDCIQILSEEDIKDASENRKISAKNDDDEGYIEVLPTELQNKEETAGT